MAGRKRLLAIVLLAAVLNGICIARSHLPAQDGLKFIRIARQFQHDSWFNVVRDTEQHPLYPALVAAVEPLCASLGSPGPDAWRIAAQSVAALASVLVLLPLFFITRTLFDERIALIAAAIYALLPVPAEVGHDALGNSLGLLFTLICLLCGARAMRKADWRLALAAGCAGGMGYLARPEAILAPAALGLAWVFARFRWRQFPALVTSAALPAMALSALVLVGGYALVKGEVTEKLALRRGAVLGPQQIMIRSVPQWLPRGLNAAELDFSPKEESEQAVVHGPIQAVRWMACEWWDELCWGFAIMAVWGLARQRFIVKLCHDRAPAESAHHERLVLGMFAGVFTLALARHATVLGYLSGRHVLPLVLISVPWAAAGTFICLRGLGVKLPWQPRTAWTTCAVMSGLVVLTMAAYQLRPSHPTRWGHWAAGRWLADHAAPGEPVLDTHGWARFVSNAPGYDYWHVRQALTDSRLSYVVVGHEELEAKSRRAKTLSALLTYAATPLADFPVYVNDRNVGAMIYGFHRPASWEGLKP
jgi:4-amino-4-deoxy-L-arabinose transferase-like glycosyltransferase